MPQTSSHKTSPSIVEAIDGVTNALERIKNVATATGTQQLVSNKQLVKEFFQAIDAGDPDRLGDYIAVDYIDHNPQFPNLPHGLAGVQQGFKIALEAWSDFHHEIVTQVAEGDLVVSQMVARGVHVGEFLGIAPTGKTITMPGIAIHRIADGKLVEHWAQIDQVSVLRQLGQL